MREYKIIYTTRLGKAYHGDCIQIMRDMPSCSIDLVITSPPFPLHKKKSYGNVSPDKYSEWFIPFAQEIYRLLKPKGSFILDIGGAWNKGEPTRNLCIYELLLLLCRPRGKFYLAQEFYWYNPSKMPTPAQWVTIKRVRVKDAVHCIWWLSKSKNPKASNVRVLKSYSERMEELLEKGYKRGVRPSGHNISEKWRKRNPGSIPPNIIIAANTNSCEKYIVECKKHNINIHPARFVKEVPEFFIKFLTLPNDIVLDPFGGSNVVGQIAERLGRRWLSIERELEYVVGSAFRFDGLGEKIYNKYKDLLDNA